VLPKQVNYEALSRDGQIDFELFRHSLMTDDWLEAEYSPLRR